GCGAPAGRAAGRGGPDAPRPTPPAPPHWQSPAGRPGSRLPAGPRRRSSPALRYHRELMTLRTLEEYRATGTLANLDEDWLAEIESDPTDIDWYLGITRELAASNDEERARDLLELYDAELVSR